MSYLNFVRREEERRWAALAHASIALGIILGLLLPFGAGIASLAGPIAAFVIYLVKKDESSWVARQAMQALLYQLVLAIIGFAFSMVLGFIIGILRLASPSAALFALGPLALVVPVLSLIFLVYALYGAYQCYRGRNFRYAVIGSYVRLP